MILGDFIEGFIKPNSIIALWRTQGEEKEMILKDFVMEWEILKNKNLCELEVVSIFSIYRFDHRNSDTIDIEVK